VQCGYNIYTGNWYKRTCISKYHWVLRTALIHRRHAVLHNVYSLIFSIMMYNYPYSSAHTILCKRRKLYYVHRSNRVKIKGGCPTLSSEKRRLPHPLVEPNLAHKLQKREDWTVRRIFLSLLIDHMMTKYISHKPPKNRTATVVNERCSGP
jgi:hypothetical protein